MKLSAPKDEARSKHRRCSQLERRGGASLDAVLPAVRRIVADVRKRGDRALFRYAAEIRRPCRRRCTARDARRDGRRVEGPRPRSARCAHHRRKADSQLRPAPTAALMECLADRRPHYWPARAPAWLGWLLCSQRPSSAALHAADDRHSRAGGRRPAHRCRLAARPAPETLAAAHLLGITEFYRLGGAHAIAALAYGTATIARVDKIVGPGNLYVTAAKRLVAFDCAIDMLAGPTEIVVTSERGTASDIASDLVAQAEHDPEALAIFVTTRADLAKDVIAEAKLRSRRIPSRVRRSTATASSSSPPSIDEARAITNRLAPEHLTVDSASDLKWVTNAGSVFVGRWSAQPMGDYISGPNHTLPTGGTARVRGGLSVNDFVKLITVQEYTANALRILGPQAALLAEAEGLTGHAEAIRTRPSEEGGPVAELRKDSHSARPAPACRP